MTTLETDFQRFLPLLSRDIDDEISQHRARTAEQSKPGNHDTSTTNNDCNLDVTITPPSPPRASRSPTVVASRSSRDGTRSRSESPLKPTASLAPPARTHSQRSNLSLQLDAKGVAQSKQERARRARAKDLLLQCLDTLMSSSDDGKDSRLLRSFIRTHEQLIPSKELASLVIELYYSMDDDPEIDSHSQQVFKGSVVRFINRWCDFPTYISRSVRRTFARFGHQIAQEEESIAIEVTTQPDVAILDVFADIVTHRDNNIDVLEHAIAFLDYECYINMSDEDLWQFSNDKRTPAMQQAENFSGQLTRWVAATILSDTSIDGRVAILTKWIGVTEALLHNHNYNAAFALQAAFSHPAILNLYTTRVRLPAEATRMLRIVQKLQAHDHERYLKRLVSVFQTQASCVPCLKHVTSQITDEVTALQLSDPVHSIGSKGWQELQTTMDDYLSFQDRALDSETEVDAELVSQLREALSVAVDDSWLMQMSNCLEPWITDSYRPFFAHSRLALKEACCGSMEEADYTTWLLRDEPEATLFDILGAEGITPPDRLERGQSLQLKIATMTEQLFERYWPGADEISVEEWECACSEQLAFPSFEAMTQADTITRAEVISYLFEVHWYTSTRVLPHMFEKPSAGLSTLLSRPCDHCEQALSKATMRFCSDCGQVAHAHCQLLMSRNCSPLHKLNHASSPIESRLGPSLTNYGDEVSRSGMSTPLHSLGIREGLSSSQSSARSSLVGPPSPLVVPQSPTRLPSGRRVSNSSTSTFFSNSSDMDLDIRRPKATHRKSLITADGRKVVVQTKGKSVRDV
eukprot:m.178178 g.178178  ORF g.178178 m.178178 type:complete len:805 (+) comp16829_c0_seq2:170-2584(+)